MNALIQGLYDQTLNTMVSDTLTVFLRKNISPFDIADSSKSVLNSSGYGEFSFSKASEESVYYYQLSHRNSLETWSKAGGEIFSLSKAVYDFTDSDSKAFGNNLKMKGSKYCIYNGDVNNDGVIDLTDLVIVFNDVSNLSSGYLVSDINGDEFTDLSDLLIVYNNASEFVINIIP